LELLVAGRSNKVIAVERGCAENTVEFHVTGILQRAQCANRSELLARLLQPHT
jgi:DNA-binding NarL/FixJ family response regulator